MRKPRATSALVFGLCVPQTRASKGRLGISHASVHCRWDRTLYILARSVCSGSISTNILAFPPQTPSAAKKKSQNCADGLNCVFVLSNLRAGRTILSFIFQSLLLGPHGLFLTVGHLKLLPHSGPGSRRLPVPFTKNIWALFVLKQRL